MPSAFYYLDHAAATPVDERVVTAMMPYLTDRFFNPSSPYAQAVEVRREYESAKARLAATFGARADELVMTAGATESINLAFSGISGHIVTSAIEHDAVLAAAKHYEHTLVQPTEKGFITPEAVEAALTPQTQLVSIQLANNELGTVQPLGKIADVVEKERRRRQIEGESLPIIFHSDASQGFGQIDVHTARLGVDMLTLNAGKMYGPKQVGLLWVRPGIQANAVIVGGGQERGLRSGTENVSGVIGFALAAEIAVKKRSSEAKQLGDLRNMMQELLTDAVPNLTVTGHGKKRLAGSLHIAVAGIDAERVLFALERRGVMVATGSACAANKGTRSHVLEAIGMNETEADGSLRITLGRLNDETSCGEAATIIIEEIKREQERVLRRA
jgi:cysteine desulfurase